MNREGVKVSQNVAAAIAHEMRNPVYAIASAAQLVRYRIADDPVMEKNIGRILREAERLNALVSALLEYGRPAPVRLELADPDEVWTDVLESHRGALESRALLVQHTPAEPRATCSLDAEQLALAFGNGLTNAIEATEEGGDLSVVSSTAADGTWTTSLRNDGPPLSPEIAPRVFEPLATTKAGHAGIGLATAHRVVSEHGGTISLHSADTPGGGTTLTFTLPPARLP
jgi:signal transduction histidine kinase